MKSLTVYFLTILAGIALVGCNEASHNFTALNFSQSSQIIDQTANFSTPEVTKAIDAKALYTRLCSACHADDGHGKLPTAPNLRTSKLDIVGIRKIITFGKLEKGMVAYGSILKPKEIEAVTLYVKAFQQ